MIDWQEWGAYRWRLLIVKLSALGWLVFFATSSYAGLGENASSIERDRISLMAENTTITAYPQHSVHEFVTTDGARVRQFVSLQGAVFAIAWSGQDLPDLKVLLAGYHGDYVQAAQAPRARRRGLLVSNQRLVLHINALPRGFVGAAYLPSLVPAGVAHQDLR